MAVLGDDDTRPLAILEIAAYMSTTAWGDGADGDNDDTDGDGREDDDDGEGGLLNGEPRGIGDGCGDDDSSGTDGTTPSRRSSSR